MLSWQKDYIPKSGINRTEIILPEKERSHTWEIIVKTELPKQKILQQKVSDYTDEPDPPLNMDIWILESDYEWPALICNPFKIWTKQFLLTI